MSHFTIHLDDIFVLSIGCVAFVTIAIGLLLYAAMLLRENREAATSPNSQSFIEEVEQVSTQDEGNEDNQTKLLKDEPWRETPFQWTSDDEEQLLKKVRNFKLIGLPVPKACILLFGQTGAGKTSFINSCDNVLIREANRIGNSGIGYSSITKKYEIYQLQNEDDRTVNFVFGDTMGFSPGTRGPILMEDIRYLLNGNIAKDYMFLPIPIDQKNSHFVAKPGLQDCPHVVTFIIDSNIVNTVGEKQWEKYRDIKEEADILELPTMVVLTKIDNLCEDLSKVFFSSKVEDAVSKVSEEIGLEPSAILPTSNYFRETHMNLNKNILTLETMNQLISQAKVYLRKKRDQKQKRDKKKELELI